MADLERGSDLVRRSPCGGFPELARALSLAVRIEPALLRHARLLLAPAAPIAVEAALWFSPIVLTRNATGVVFDPDAIAVLRRQLSGQLDLGRRAHALVTRLHQNWPSTLRHEEDLVWRSVSGDRDLEAQLRPVLKAMVTHADGGMKVARWVTQAWARLPEEITASGLGRQIEVAATLRTGIPVGRIRPGEHALPDDLAWLTPPTRTAEVQVALVTGTNGVRFVRPDADRPAVISVPATSPPLLELSWTADGRRHHRIVPAVPGTDVAFDGPVSGLAIRTLSGVLVETLARRPVAAGRPRLPEYARNRLVALLLEVEELHYPDTRGLVVSELRNRLGPGFEVPMQKSDRLYTIALIEECQQHYGGLRKLVDALRLISPGHYRVDEAADLVAAHIPLEILLPGERADLRKLLAALTSEVDSGSLYRAAVGPLAPTLESAPNDLLGVVDELLNMGIPPGQLPPLLVFVEYLAAAVDGRGQTAQALRRWNADVVRRHELPPQLLAAARESAHFHTTKPGGRASLLVQIEEDGLNHNRFQVSVWLWQGSDSDQLFRDDRSYTLEEIPEVIDRALLDCGSLLMSDSVEPMVEFILPHRLLVMPVDKWLITQGGPFRSRLGVYYPVVVRSLDRLRTTSLPLRQQWRAKWRWLQEHSGLHPESAVRWMADEDGRDPQRLYRELSGDQPVAVAWFGAPPPEHLGVDSVLGAVIWAGVPAAVWCSGDHEDHSQLVDIVETTPLSRLPEAVQRARKEADTPGAADDHCGNHLSLLWDDPERLPEPGFGLT